MEFCASNYVIDWLKPDVKDTYSQVEHHKVFQLPRLFIYLSLLIRTIFNSHVCARILLYFL
jgi:hypothetical protein